MHSPRLFIDTEESALPSLVLLPFLPITRILLLPTRSFDFHYQLYHVPELLFNSKCHFLFRISAPNNPQFFVAVFGFGSPNALLVLVVWFHNHPLLIMSTQATPELPTQVLIVFFRGSCVRALWHFCSLASTSLGH